MTRAIIVAPFAALPLAVLSLTACTEALPEPVAVTDGAWTLDGEASELSYVTIKADEIAEINSFEGLSGSVSGEGVASLEIDLSSVETGVDIRNERMREIFFVVSDNPTASVSATLDPASFEALQVGDSVTTELAGTLNLKGVEAPFQTDVTVTRAGPDRVLAVSDAPVIVDAGQLELNDGLAQLQELAGLPSITPVVPVTFSLVFERQN
ncbi:MAG: YceI family protein [Pseudomonadota bacterium]